MTETLLAMYGDRVAATVTRDGDRLDLRYDPGWSRDPPFPLSLSLPVARRTHAPNSVAAYLSNLLPDNARVLEAWAKKFHVSARSPFRLLLHVGEDCAGAFAWVRPERVAGFAAAIGDVDWLTDRDVALRLARLRSDVAAWRLPGDTGHFSLAGAQPKIALLLREDRWGLPSGTIATTHILKPPIADLDGHVENEHFCLHLARRLGLPAAHSEVVHFVDEVAIVVQRFDRMDTAAMAAQAAADAADCAARAASAEGASLLRLVRRAAESSARARSLHELSQRTPVLRLHQEDLCQATGAPPEDKYQNDGGPGAKQVADLLRSASSDATADLDVFKDALLFQWLIAGTDAHAKNYAILHGTGGRVRLAPLYDVASALPYPQLELRRLKLAMKLGSTYRLEDVRRKDVDALDRQLGLPSGTALASARRLADALPDAAVEVRAKLHDQGLRHPGIAALAELLAARAHTCGARLA